MPRASYRIIPVDQFNYEVCVDEPNVGRHTITGFQSIAEAENWIEIQKRHDRALALERSSEVLIPILSLTDQLRPNRAVRPTLVFDVC
jgi:hypothetical protein